MGMLKKFDACRDDETANERVLEWRKQRKASLVHELRAANKELLGKLHADQLYLEKLLVNPLLNNSATNREGGDGVDIVQKKVYTSSVRK